MSAKTRAVSTEDVLLTRLEGLRKIFANNGNKPSTADLRDAMPLLEAIIKNQKSLSERLEKLEGVALPDPPAGIKPLSKTL